MLRALSSHESERLVPQTFFGFFNLIAGGPTLEVMYAKKTMNERRTTAIEVTNWL